MEKKHKASTDNFESKNRPMAITNKAVVLNNSNEVLLLKRIREGLNGNKWDLPGGHIEKGETIEAALKREVKEETNLNVEVISIIRAVEFSKEHKLFKNEKRGLRFLVRSSDRDVITQKNEHVKYRWLAFDEAIALLDKKDGFENEKRETLIAAKKLIEMQNATDNWKRAIADLENYKKRCVRDNDNFRKFCLENFIMELLPVLDNFEMALKHIPEDQKDNGWTNGIMHIKKQLQDVLSSQGVQEIDAKKGDLIDEAIHEVIFAKGKKGKVKIKKILKKGYKMDDKVIRPVSIETE